MVPQGPSWGHPSNACEQRGWHVSVIELLDSWWVWGQLTPASVMPQVRPGVRSEAG